MASAQVHALTGMALQEASQGRLWAAIPLALASHYALDDLNWDEIAIYHGLGKGWRQALYIGFQIVVWTALIWLAWHNPLLLIGAVAGMLFDFDHVYRKITGQWIGNIIGKEWGLHSPSSILKGQWGIVAWAIVTILLLLAVWR